MIDAREVRAMLASEIAVIEALVKTVVDPLVAVCEPGPGRDLLIEKTDILEHRMAAAPGRVAAMGPFESRDHLKAVLDRAMAHVIEPIDEILAICRDHKQG
jgi:hypothetical protein